jgi:hypothetical protein
MLIPIQLGRRYPGLTLTAQLVDSSGVDSGNPIAAGFAEVGGGNYLWSWDPGSFTGGIKILSGTDVMGFTAIEHTLGSPPIATGVPDREIWAGDDYLYVDGRAKVISFDVDNALPDIVGEVWIEFTGGLNIQATIVRATGPSKQIRFDLTAAQTGAMAKGNLRWVLYELDVDSHRRTLTYGTYVVRIIV